MVACTSRQLAYPSHECPEYPGTVLARWSLTGEPPLVDRLVMTMAI